MPETTAMRDEMTPITFREAIREGLFEEMERDERVFVLGEDIAGGAVWGTTKGLHDRFPGRVRDTPISESAIVGFSVGAAMSGLRPVPEIMFADLTTVAMDEIVNQAAKMRYMTGGQAKVPLVIRVPCGLSKNIGAQGSQALEAWFAHVPGLLVVVPATPADAKGLIKSAIRSDDPVLFFEYRLLYATKGIVPIDPEVLVPLGKAQLLREGSDLTLISYGRMSALARDAIEELEQRNVAIDHVDLRSLVPFDEETVLESVERTGRVLIVEEACERVSFGAWVAARIQERAFDALRGPIRRVASLNAPKPVAPVLESFVFPDVSRIVRAAENTIAGASLRAGAVPDYWTSAARERR